MKLLKENRSGGFTFIELMIAMAIASILVIGMFQFFETQQKADGIQRQLVHMNQSLRAAMYFMERDIMMAGYDDTRLYSVSDFIDNDGVNGIDDIGESRASDGIDNDCDGSTADAAEGSFRAGISSASARVITVSMDNNIDRDICDDQERITYSDIMINPNNLQLFRQRVGFGSDIIAENIEEIGFAYAYDSDGDGALETSGGNVIWAHDNSGDGNLDMSLDTNADGEINTGDTIGGVALGTVVPITNIRAVMVWILARTDFIRGYSNNDTYVVANRLVAGGGDNFKRRLIVTTIKFRNMGI